MFLLNEHVYIWEVRRRRWVYRDARSEYYILGG
jgi:hypothetical protein